MNLKRRLMTVLRSEMATRKEHLWSEHSVEWMLQHRSKPHKVMYGWGKWKVFFLSCNTFCDCPHSDLRTKRVIHTVILGLICDFRTSWNHGFFFHPWSWIYNPFFDWKTCQLPIWTWQNPGLWAPLYSDDPWGQRLELGPKEANNQKSALACLH